MKEQELSSELIKEINYVGDKSFEKFTKDKFKLNDETEKEEGIKESWKEIYFGINDVLKKYCDLKEEYYPLIATWIIGTHFHEQFYTYPYLFLNAMKGSGKTRLLKLIKILAKDGDMLNSLTEAVLFRTKGTLCIDEFEGITRNGSENLRELLNSAYKKGTKVKRLKKKKTMDGEEQVVEEFDVYRPIAIANIWGMENVLGDRCIPLILEKSSKSVVINLIESFEHDYLINKLHSLMCKSVVSAVSLPIGIYIKWNDYITYNNTTTLTDNNTNNTIFDKIYKTGIDGRHLELALPLLVIASYLGEEILDELLAIIAEIVKIKKEDEFTENYDVSFIDFVSQYTHEKFVSIKELVREFKDFLQTSEEWINDKWVGRALKRLNLILEKKRLASGRYVRLDIEKAQEKIKIFK